MPRRANTTTSPERALLAVDEVAEPERVVENRPLDYGLKAVHLTEIANRVWKRASEYRLIIAERRCLTAGNQPPPKATAGQPKLAASQRRRKAGGSVEAELNSGRYPRD